MKLFILSLATALPLLLGSCAATGIRVVDSRTKDPVYNASVTAVNGNYSSDSYYTDSNGFAAEPTLPMGAKQLVIKKSGYNTKSISPSY